MDRGELDSERRIGRVKAAIGLFGERITEGNYSPKKSQIDFPEKSSRTRELHMARKDIGQFDESRQVADSIKAQAESELFTAKKTVCDLTLRIEESNSRAKAQMQKLEKLRIYEEERALMVRNVENYQHQEVMRELEFIKKELRKLKLDMASVLEEKNRADKEIEASSLRISSCSKSAEAIRKEIEEVNEEQVLVELAQIEAAKEIAAIEAQRKDEADRFSSAMENTKKKMNEFLQEIESSKETEMNLAVTIADLNVLETGLKLAKMDKKVQRSESSSKGKELDSHSVLQSVNEELEEGKKELASIREEGFRFMASMDVIRDELKHVSQEAARLKKKEEKADVIVQSLNSKLLRGKAKLEAVSAAEEKGKMIVSNLDVTLEQLKTEAEAAKKERELIYEETANMKAEVEKTESEIDLAEEKLQAAMQELEAVRSSETMALKNLGTLVENTMRARGSASQHSSTITISKFEFEYLKGRANGAEELADKKVAAAQAWIEALKASEKEILMNTEMTQRKIRELRVEEEKQTCIVEKTLSVKRAVEGELQNWREEGKENSEPENLLHEEALHWKSIKENGTSPPVRRAKYRKSASPAIRHRTKPGSSTVRRRKMVMPNLAKFFNNKNMESDRCIL